MDAKVSSWFYQTIINLDTIPEPFHDGKHAWFKIGVGHCSAYNTGGRDKKGILQKPKHCFSVASVGDFIKILQKNNIAWEDRDGTKMAITTRVDGVKQIWLQDPDGYWLEINDAKE